MLFINKLFNSIACLLYFINLQLVIAGRTWILLYLGRTVYKHLWVCLALYKSYWILVFWAPCSSGGWGGGWIGVGGLLEGAPHTYAHACMHMHTHACIVNMIISCKWPPPLGESMGIPYDVIHTCACMLMHVCIHMCVRICGGAPPHHPPPPSIHSHPQGGTPRISQNSIALELIEIFQFCLKIWNLWRLPHRRVGV